MAVAGMTVGRSVLDRGPGSQTFDELAVTAEATCEGGSGSKSATAYTPGEDNRALIEVETTGDDDVHADLIARNTGRGYLTMLYEPRLVVCGQLDGPFVENCSGYRGGKTVDVRGGWWNLELIEVHSGEILATAQFTTDRPTCPSAVVSVGGVVPEQVMGVKSPELRAWLEPWVDGEQPVPEPAA